jgi:hypothetical protein
MWTHRDIETDVFSFQALLDAHEYLDVKEENTEIYRAWQDSLRPQK